MVFVIIMPKQQERKRQNCQAVPTFPHLLQLTRLYGRRDSSVNIGTRLRGRTTEESSFDSRERQEIFSCPQSPYWLRGPHSLLFNENREHFPRMERPGYEADHSSPSSAEVEYIWIHISIT
jgi:hypothetical protein